MPGNGKLGFSVTPLFHPMTVCENRRQVVTEWLGPACTALHSTAPHTRIPCIRDMALRGRSALRVRIVLNAWMPPAPSSDAVKLMRET